MSSFRRDNLKLVILRTLYKFHFDLDDRAIRCKWENQLSEGWSQERIKSPDISQWGSSEEINRLHTGVVGNDTGPVSSGTPRK
jgi:hypothetical protein